MKFVTPAKAGVQPYCNCSKKLDSGLRRNDGIKFYDSLQDRINT